MADFFRWLGDLRVTNLADYGVLADTIEVVSAIVMVVGGIYITHLIQVWADKIGEQPGAVNRGQGGGMDRYEQRTMRD
jgi:hypothetical protein